MMYDGWCPDCDLRSAVIDEQGDHAWATCTECGAGWTWRDEPSETLRPVDGKRSADRQQERRAA